MASRTPGLRHAPELQMSFFLGEVAHTYGISLGKYHSPQISTPYNPTLPGHHVFGITPTVM